MDISQIEKEIMDFADQRAKSKFSKDSKLTPEVSFIHLTEEVGEIARQLFNKTARPDIFDESNLKEEIADVILEAVVLAHLCKVDLNKEISFKLDALFKSYGFSKTSPN